MTDAELKRYMSEPRSLDELATTIGREWKARHVEDVTPWAWNLANSVANDAEGRGMTPIDAIDLGVKASELAIESFNAEAIQ